MQVKFIQPVFTTLDPAEMHVGKSVISTYIYKIFSMICSFVLVGFFAPEQIPT